MGVTMTSITAQHGFATLTPEQQVSHRSKIGLRAEAILSQFWREDSTPEAVQALEIEGWMDVLENCSHIEIRQAWATYQKTGPRTANGRLYKPDAGAIYRLILDERPRPQIVRQAAPEPHREIISPQRKAEIMREVFGSDTMPAPRRFGGDAAE